VSPLGKKRRRHRHTKSRVNTQGSKGRKRKSIGEAEETEWLKKKQTTLERATSKLFPKAPKKGKRGPLLFEKRVGGHLGKEVLFRASLFLWGMTKEKGSKGKKASAVFLRKRNAAHRPRVPGYAIWGKKRIIGNNSSPGSREKRGNW